VVRILLLDSASLYWRAFHALPDSIVDPSGQPVNAVRGFLDTVTRLVDARRPDRVVACWDDDWRPQWRVDLVPGYKAHRVEQETVETDEEVVPDTLGPQIPLIAELCRILAISVMGAPAYEADDVIATLAARAVADGCVVDIASGDRDLVQLVSPQITLLYTGGTTKSRGGQPWLILDPTAVRERFDIPPESYALMAVLRGDPSDGLPGVRGIGQKTAVALVNAFPTIDDLLGAARQSPQPPMTARLAQAIVEHEEVIRASLAVTALEERQDIPSVGPAPDFDEDAARQYGVQLGLTRSMEQALAVWGRN
jgi:5'-3' exonuclease